MDKAPIDLTNFNMITNGDKEMEKELFIEFINSTQEHINSMDKAISSGDKDAWKSACHAVKGTSINMGAAPLSHAAKKGQESFEADSQVKSNIVSEIKAEFKLVKDFLEAKMKN